MQSAFDHLCTDIPYTCEEEIFQRLRSFVSSKMTKYVERASYTSNVSVTENTHFFACSFDPRTTVTVNTDLVVFDCCESLPKCITSTKDVVVIASNRRRFLSELHARNVFSTCGLTRGRIKGNLDEILWRIDAVPNELKLSFIENCSIEGTFNTCGSDVYVLKNVKVRDMTFNNAILHTPYLKL